MDAAEMYCAQCGIRLDGFAGAGRADGASPCPGCGCTSRTFQKTLEAGRVGVASDVTAHGTSGGKDLSVRRVSSTQEAGTRLLTDTTTGLYGTRWAGPRLRERKPQRQHAGHLWVFSTTREPTGIHRGSPKKELRAASIVLRLIVETSRRSWPFR